MHRIACALVVVVGCGGNDKGTDMATLSGVNPPAKSAGATSFHGMDGAGTDVLGWTIDFYSQGPGHGCGSKDAIASIGIFTNQPAGGAQKTAMLSTDEDINIANASPPTVTGDAAASMGAKGISQIAGDLMLTAVDLGTDGKTILTISGTVNAGGVDDGGGGVTLTGTFEAPNCD
ncbi:MAG TPA: hypothetical protein VLX92_34200 [Kofleriaceae bacterium]|nr:hypothetical protein [Kofleriaceae bacterium]